jgi:hypothetical protein
VGTAYLGVEHHKPFAYSEFAEMPRRDCSVVEHIQRVKEAWPNLLMPEVLEIVRIQRQQQELGVSVERCANLGEYQQALLARVKRAEKFRSQFGRQPSEGELGLMPSPPRELVNAFASGQLEYEHPETNYLMGKTNFNSQKR